MEGIEPPLLLTPTMDRRRVTRSLAQAGHSIRVWALGTYFSNSRSHWLQRYS